LQVPACLSLRTRIVPDIHESMEYCRGYTHATLGPIARALRNAALAKAYFGGSTAGKLTTAKATGAAPAAKGEPISGVSAPVIPFAEKT
jgi:hypothetical protein